MIRFMFFLLICSCNANRISLLGNDWTISNKNNYTTEGYIPGTIHTILFAKNLIPDPYYGFNDLNLRYLIFSNWMFTKTFNLSSDFLQFNKIEINFEQIDTVANIKINECFIGRTNSMFISYRFNVEKSCLGLKNQIEIEFESPIIYAKDQARIYNDSVPPDCPPAIQHGECYVQFIRKEPCSFSWGWGPAFAPIGIPGDVYLQGFNKSLIHIQLESVNVAFFDKIKNLWQIDVILSSENDQFQSQLKFQLENTTWSYETSLLFNKTLLLSLFVPDENVSRWWPNGHGNQSLYNFIVLNENQFIDSRLIGFRTVELVQNKYENGINGTSFYFSINSKPIFIKGSNWIPADSFQERVTNEQFQFLLYSAKLSNMNMLRVWGGGIYERNTFYELADRYGIMIWHDFMFACSLYPVDQGFLNNVFNEIIYQVKRLQFHPSIVLWSGNNENEQAIAENWYNVSKEDLNRTKDDYRTLYVHTIMKALQQVDKGNNRPFITSSPSNGLETINENFIAKNPQDPLYGDVHFYRYTDDSWDPRTYPITRFISETGVQSLPSLSTWLQSTSNLSDLTYNSTFMINRQHYENQTEMMLKWINSNLLFPMTNDSLRQFKQLIYLTQINQAMTLKSISDLCRLYSSIEMINQTTSQGNTMGLMYWQLNDLWQTQSWSTIDYGLKWKIGHYYAQHMYSPVYPLVRLNPYLANLTDENAQISIYIVNEILNGVKGQLICSLYKLNSLNSLYTFDYLISFDSFGFYKVANLSYSSLMKRVNCTNEFECLLNCVLNYNQNRIEQTLFFNRPKYFKLFNPNIQIENIQRRTSTIVDITLTADRPALFVWIELLNENINGYFSMNAFHMLQPMINLTFYSWTILNDLDIDLLNIEFTSLFNITIS